MYVRNLMTGVSLATALLAADVARAAVYDFTLTGVANDVTGQFTTSGPANADGTFDITSASGVISGLGAFTLTPGNGESLSGAGGAVTYSNLYTPGSPGFAFNGLEVQGTSFDANLYDGLDAGFPACTSACLSLPEVGGADYNPGEIGVLTITAVPEASTWLLIMLGVFGLGAALRRSRAQLALAAG